MKSKKSLLINLTFILTGLFLSGNTCSAQATAIKTASQMPEWLSSPALYLGISVTLILVLAILALTNASITLTKVIAQGTKKSAATIVFFLLSATAFSQAEVPAAVQPNTLPQWVFNPDVYIYGFLLFIMIISIVTLYRINKKLLRIISPQLFEVKEAVVNVAVEAQPSFLRKIYLRMVDSVPVTQEKDIMLDHDYDGIKELDNNLPPWWIYGFYVTIIFGVIYLFVYHVAGTGKLQGEEYKEELLIAAKQKEERMKASNDNVNEENVTLLADAEDLSKGKEIFTKNCVVCHLADGGGIVGPNLTDEYWIHGGGIKNVFKTIVYGVPNKGMISWQSQLTPKQMQQVSSYVLTFAGTKPAVGKEPQGDKWIEQSQAPADSTAIIKTDSSIVAVADTLKK